MKLVQYFRARYEVTRAENKEKSDRQEQYGRERRLRSRVVANGRRPSGCAVTEAHLRRAAGVRHCAHRREPRLMKSKARLPLVKSATHADAVLTSPRGKAFNGEL